MRTERQAATFVFAICIPEYEEMARGGLAVNIVECQEMPRGRLDRTGFATPDGLSSGKAPRMCMRRSIGFRQFAEPSLSSRRTFLLERQSQNARAFFAHALRKAPEIPATLRGEFVRHLFPEIRSLDGDKRMESYRQAEALIEDLLPEHQDAARSELVSTIDALQLNERTEAYDRGMARVSDSSHFELHGELTKKISSLRIDDQEDARAKSDAAEDRLSERPW